MATPRIIKHYASAVLIFIFSATTSALASDNEMVDSLIKKADVYIFSNPDTAEKIIDEAILIARQINYDDGIAGAKRTKGLIKYYAIEFSQALDLLIESNSIYQRTKNKKGQASALNLIAVIYSDQDRNKESLDIYNKILSIAQEDTFRMAATFNNIGATYLGMNNLMACHEYYLKAINLIQKIEEPESESQFSNNLGALYIKLNNADSAYYYIRHGLEIANSIQNLHRLSNSYEIFGDYYYWQEDIPLALENYHRALEYAREMGVVYEIGSIAGGLSRAYASNKDFENAHAYLSLQKQMDDSVKNKEIATYITQIELEKGFQKERDLNEALNARNRMERDIYLIIIFFVVVIFIILSYSYVQKKKAYQLLQTQRDTLLAQKEEIRIQAEQLTELNNIKAKLFSIISHDLRSPLSSLISIVEATKKNTLSKEQFQEMLNDMHENIGATANLANNLLGWARSQQEGMSIRPENLKIRKLVEEETAMQYTAMKNKNLKLVNNIPGEIFAFADENMLRLIVRNLLSNAIKFSYRNGCITLSGCLVDDYAEVKIKDEGMGMPASTKEMLFTQAVLSTNGTHNEAGTGLGLILCREFIMLNKGKISTESEPGKGSTFTFRLPLARKKQEALL